MKQVTVYKWRIQWAGKWTTTSRHATEEEIRREHPEAVMVDGTMQIRTEAETPQEIETIHRANTLNLGEKGTAGF